MSSERSCIFTNPDNCLMFQQMVLSTGAHVSVRTVTSRPEPGPGEVKKVQIACAAKHQTVSSGKSSAPSERTPCRSKPSHGFRVGAEFFILQRFPRKQREKSSKTVMPHGIRRTSDPKTRAGIRRRACRTHRRRPKTAGSGPENRPNRRFPARRPTF